MRACIVCLPIWRWSRRSIFSPRLSTIHSRTAPLPQELDPRVRDALAAQGIDSLYEHQAETWDAAARGEHLIVTTGTASGKTLAFNLPGFRYESPI